MLRRLIVFFFLLVILLEFFPRRSHFTNMSEYEGASQNRNYASYSCLQESVYAQHFLHCLAAPRTGTADTHSAGFAFPLVPLLTFVISDHEAYGAFRNIIPHLSVILALTSLLYACARSSKPYLGAALGLCYTVLFLSTHLVKVFSSSFLADFVSLALLLLATIWGEYDRITLRRKKWWRKWWIVLLSLAALNKPLQLPLILAVFSLLTELRFGKRMLFNLLAICGPVILHLAVSVLLARLDLASPPQFYSITSFPGLSAALSGAATHWFMLVGWPFTIALILLMAATLANAQRKRAILSALGIAAIFNLGLLTLGVMNDSEFTIMLFGGILLASLFAFLELNQLSLGQGTEKRLAVSLVIGVLILTLIHAAT